MRDQQRRNPLPVARVFNPCPGRVFPYTGYRDLDNGDCAASGRVPPSSAHKSGGIYSITFRLADSLPDDVLESWIARSRSHLCKRAAHRTADSHRRESTASIDSSSERVENTLMRATANVGFGHRSRQARRRMQLQHFDGRALSPARVVHHAESRPRGHSTTRRLRSAMHFAFVEVIHRKPGE